MTDLNALAFQIKLAAVKWLDPDVQKGLEAQDKPAPLPMLPQAPAKVPMTPAAPVKAPPASNIPYGSPRPKKAADMNPQRNATEKDVPKILTTIKKTPELPLDRESAGEKTEKVANSATATLAAVLARHV